MLDRIDKLFVIFAGCLGLFLIFFTPPLQSPDEPAHFSRAYSVSEGHITAKKLNNVSGDYAAESLLRFEDEVGYLTFQTSKRISFDKLYNSAKIKLNENKKVFSDQKYQALYSVFAYLPQSTGIFLSKFFTDSVYWILIWGKIFLLGFYTILGYFSIKSMPFLKWLVFLILLMPMSLSLGASVSADGVLIALSIFYFSKILQCTYSKNSMSKRDFFSFLLLALLLALIKQSFLFSLFIFFIPKQKFDKVFESKYLKSYLVKLLILLLPALTASIVWSKISYSLFVPLNNSNPEIQLQFILSHPFVYLKTLFTTLRLNFLILVYETIGILGWIEVFLFPFTYWLFLLILFFNVFFSYNDSKRFASSRFQKVLLVFLTAINIVFVSTVIYVSWIQPYVISPFEGLQGRYFIPFLLPFFTLIFLVVKDYVKVVPKKFIAILNIALVILTYLNLAFGLYIRFYAQF